MSNKPILVCHVQRTGGTSLRQMIELSAGCDSVYPSTPVVDQREGRRYLPPREIIERWNELPPHQFLFAHCLASFVELLPISYERVAFIREPIERSVSITQLHAQHTGRPVSDLLHDRQFLESHIVDMQTRIFGHGVELALLRPQETPLASDKTLADAVRQIREFSFIGITETYELSIKRFDERFGSNLSNSLRRENGSRQGDLSSTEMHRILAPLVQRDDELYRQFVARGAPFRSI